MEFPAKHVLLRRFHGEHSTMQAMSCSHPTCHTPLMPHMASMGQAMTKVSAVDAKQKGRLQLQQLLPDRKSSASYNVPDSFLVKKLNFATADKRPLIHSKAFLSHHLHGHLDVFSDQAPCIKAWFRRQNHEVCFHVKISVLRISLPILILFPLQKHLPP